MMKQQGEEKFNAESTEENGEVPEKRRRAGLKTGHYKKHDEKRKMPGLAANAAAVPQIGTWPGATKKGTMFRLQPGIFRYRVPANYFWPAPESEKILSTPTTWPWSVPGINVSRSISPDLASAMLTWLTSSVRPTARS